MMYYSTNKKAPDVSLREAVLRSLAPDGGLYMPREIPRMPDRFFRDITGMSLQESSFEVAKALFGSDVEESVLKEIVYDSLNFDIPLVEINGGISTLELFHGPTLAFKDVGARFMARMLAHFNRGNDETIHILVATSGDTGSAVANGFLDVPGIHVTVLYPKGKVSSIQEKQFTTLGRNITAIEVDGVFDDCQRLVKQAFSDQELNRQMKLSSANSINLARLLPQSFYYFHAWAQWPDKENPPYICVPSGNFGNLCAALIAHRMGMPAAGFVAATNVNDVVPEYLQTAGYRPRPSRPTISNAMDVGEPSNFVRILELYKHSHIAMTKDISGYSYMDDQTRETMKNVHKESGYTLDPHGAVGYRALAEELKRKGGKGYFVETAHPAKFKETVDETLEIDLALPERLKSFMEGKKEAVSLLSDYEEFKNYIVNK